jgi:hypothetical protein
MATEMIPLAVAALPAATLPFPTAFALAPNAALLTPPALLRKPMATAKSLLAPDEVPMEMLPCPQSVASLPPAQGCVASWVKAWLSWQSHRWRLRVPRRHRSR